MAGKVDVVLLQPVKWLGQKNDVVSVSVAYAKNVLFAKWQAKVADAAAKNTLIQKEEAEKKRILHIGEIRDSLILYIKAGESLIIKRKVTPSWGLYEKVHESDIRDAIKQWNIIVPTEINIQKNVWDSVGSQNVQLTWSGKKMMLPFVIKETY